MNDTIKKQTVNISPGVAILSILKYIEYEHWFAISEFIDNAIDSYLKNKVLLHHTEGENYQLEVSIEIDSDNNKIVIRDNAAGIAEKDFARAFRAAERPPDNSQLSEFGMGMKTAACWYSDYWTVRTTALGEPTVKTVRFDMRKIYHDNLSELEFIPEPASANIHYTVIELTEVFRLPRGSSTLMKIKRHLESIYREFTRNGILRLKFNGDYLEFESPKILTAPIYSDKNSPPILWRRDISFDVEEGLSVHGFVAIRQEGATSEAGLALFRRGRVIQGTSYEQNFRPEIIFGKSNSFRSQRVFGELHLDGFQVTFTKKAFQADENMEIFLQLLHEELSASSFPLLKQAENYRSRASEVNYAKMATPVLRSTVVDLSNKLPAAVNKLRTANPLPFLDPNKETPLPILPSNKSVHEVFTIHFNNLDWEISIELSYDISVELMYEVSDVFIPNKTPNSSTRQVGIRLSLTHPFMVQHIDTDKTKLEPVLRMVAALGLSEVVAKESGAASQREIRRNFNQLINHLTLNN
ncbi:ATP-binding protein [Fibrella aquatica]|uniref:ATP-binding protein n=1 Tax=Fibrella aquatica TaxID=3242487 RepID=UPI0035225503